MPTSIKHTSYNVRPDRVSKKELDNIVSKDSIDDGVVVLEKETRQIRILTNGEFQYVNPHGWCYYRDSEATTATQVFGSTPSQLSIDGLGGTTTCEFAPYEIRGISELWENDTLKPINIGDSYVLRIDLDILTTSSNPTRFEVVLDIGDTPDGTGGNGSIIIAEQSVTLKGGNPQSHSVAFPIFSLNTFFTNGGTFWISANSGTITVDGRGIFISRISNGQL